MGRGNEAERILVLRSGAVGDCILSTPALAALRRAYPTAHITLLGDPFSVDLFRPSPDVDEAIGLDSKLMRPADYLAALFRLRRRRFSLLVDMHGNGRSFVQTLVIGGRRRIGFEVRKSRQWIYTDRSPYRLDVHTVLRQAEVLTPLGIRLDRDDRRLHLALTSEEREQARRIAGEAGFSLDSPFVILHGTVGVQTSLKQWQPEKFGLVADRIQEEFGLPVVLTGHGAYDGAVVDAIRACAKRPTISLFGRTPLRILAAILERGALYVGCDTGPMHLAAAVNTPVVALFGPTDLDRWHPWTRAPYRIVRTGLSCSPCPGKTCPYNVECMSSITVEEVVAAVRAVYPCVPASTRQPLPV